jgi:hypothetical protein
MAFIVLFTVFRLDFFGNVRFFLGEKHPFTDTGAVRMIFLVPWRDSTAQRGLSGMQKKTDNRIHIPILRI